MASGIDSVLDRYLEDTKELDRAPVAEMGDDNLDFDLDEALASTEQPQENPGVLRSMFPSTAQAFEDPTMVGKSENVGLGVIKDVFSAPRRTLAAATSDQKFSDPEAYMGRGMVEDLHQEAMQTPSRVQQIPSESPQDALMRMQREGTSDAPPFRSIAGSELITSAVTDPTTYLPLAGPAAKAVERVGGDLMQDGAQVLRRALKPSRPSMRAWNPPDFSVPLEKGLVPKFGGMEKAGQNIESAVENVAENKDALLKAAKIRLVGSGAVNEAKKSLIGNIARKGGLSSTEIKEVPRYMDEAFENAKSYPSFKGRKGAWTLDGGDAVEFRKWMDEQVSKGKGFGQVSQPNSRTQFYRELRRSFENQLDTRIKQKNVAGRIGEAGAEEYAGAKKELADLMPVKKAFEARLEQEPNNYAIGLRETALLGGAVASGNLGAATAKAGIGIAINRLLNRPGGAAILYDLGRSMKAPGPLKTLLTRVGESGKMTSVTARLLDALAATKSESQKKVLEKRLEEELMREANK